LDKKRINLKTSSKLTKTKKPKKKKHIASRGSAKEKVGRGETKKHQEKVQKRSLGENWRNGGDKQKQTSATRGKIM